MKKRGLKENIEIISSLNTSVSQKDKAVEEICAMMDITMEECIKAINTGVLTERGCELKPSTPIGGEVERPTVKKSHNSVLRVEDHDEVVSANE